MAPKNTKKSNYPVDKTTVITSKSSENLKPIWLFDCVDKSGPFAFDVNRYDFKHKDFLDKMIAYSNMTWGEIRNQTHDDGKSKHHFLDSNSLSKEAVDRLFIKHLEQESDNIYSFAFQNKLRIVGIRDNQFFHVLWYDSLHEVCPSSLKHT